MRHSRSAYTLMEVVLVLAVLVIVAALAIPTITGMFRGSNLNAAADTVKAELTKTRNKAIECQTPYRFAIKENTGLYRIAPDSDEYWGGSSSADSVSFDGQEIQESLVIEGTLPEKVCFGTGSGVGMSGGETANWTTVATFLADGTALEDVQFRLGLDGLDPIILQLKATTGSVTVASLPAGSNAN